MSREEYNAEIFGPNTPDYFRACAHGRTDGLDGFDLMHSWLYAVEPQAFTPEKARAFHWFGPHPDAP